MKWIMRMEQFFYTPSFFKSLKRMKRMRQINDKAMNEIQKINSTLDELDTWVANISSRRSRNIATARTYNLHLARHLRTPTSTAPGRSTSTKADNQLDRLRTSRSSLITKAIPSCPESNTWQTTANTRCAFDTF